MDIEKIILKDKFQSIREITNDHAMESVLRQVAQLTQSIAFIFAGSNRHLLTEVFEVRNRPFYKLCERITLDRTSDGDYSKHIQIAVKMRWNRALTDRKLQAIFYYSEKHPYYLNALCSRLLVADNPTVENMEKTWIK